MKLPFEEHWQNSKCMEIAEKSILTDYSTIYIQICAVIVLWFIHSCPELDCRIKLTDKLNFLQSGLFENMFCTSCSNVGLKIYCTTIVHSKIN